MAGQYEILKCPFCDKGEISCLYFPSVTSVKSSGRTALGNKSSLNKSKEVWIIRIGCPVCNKTVEEVEKELKKKQII